MTIVSLYDRPGGRGGVETVAQHLDVTLRQRGHRFVTVLAGPSYEDSAWEQMLSHVHIGPVKSLSWKHLPSTLWPFAQFIIRILRDENPDIVLINWAPMVILLRILQKIGLVRSSFVVLVYEHGDLGRKFMSPLYRWAYRTGLRQSNHVVCGGADYAAVLHRDYGVPVTAIGLALNLPAPLIARPASRMFHIVFVGRLRIEQKRVDRLLQACARLPRETSWTLQLIGDGPDRVMLENLARTLKITDHCVWSGWQADPWAVIAQATLLAFPSDFEGFSAVMIEAMAHGLPVLATDCDFGPRGVIEDGVNGWLVERSDHAFAQQLRRLALGDISIPSPETVAQTVARFSSDEVLERFLSVCHNTLHTSHRE